MHSRFIYSASLFGAVAISLVGCGASAPDPRSGEQGQRGGHGAVAGAAEVSEPQLGLTFIDEQGVVSHLDLLDESVTELGKIGSPVDIATDGRYLFAQTDSGVEIVDSGVWTWDHVDHFHYYRAEPRLLGSVEGGGPATVATTSLSTNGGTGLFFADSGEAVLLDTEALSKGEIKELFRMEAAPHAGMVVPIGSFALVTEGEAGAAVRVVAYTAEGEATGLEEPCRGASGTLTTRVGAVIGCEDGALLATIDDGELVIDRIAYPADATAAAATSFANREGRPTAAALAGANGIWLLDTRERSWTLIASPTPITQVTAVDDAESHLVALAEDGRILVLDATTGSVLADTEPLVAESLIAGLQPALVADQQRAYLSGPAEQKLFEIDFADGARIARTFDTPARPVFMAETGR